MEDLVKTALADQMLAALASVGDHIELCPDDAWDRLVAKYTFNQTVFHTLFWSDVYLGRGYDAVREQAFHRENAAIFRDYDEFKKQPPSLAYTRGDMRLYVAHCREKAHQVIGAETAETLRGPSGFDWLDISRLEAHIYNTRHIQHHASQLVLRRRLDAGDDTPWHKSGWSE